MSETELHTWIVEFSDGRKDMRVANVKDFSLTIEDLVLRDEHGKVLIYIDRRNLRAFYREDIIESED